MDDFLNNLLSQIRCKKARPYIKEEIKMHIEDQIADNIQSGMEEKDAEREAIKDMGDPIEVGISLDRIHRPQIAWRMLIIIAFISVLGIMLHYSITLQMKQYDITATSNQLLSIDGSVGFAISVLLGLVVMLVLYLIDYTTIEKYSKVIASVMILVALYSKIFSMNIAGRVFYIEVGPLRVQATAIMMLYIPIYGALIYKYRGGGLLPLMKVIFWMLVPVAIVFSYYNIMVAGIMFISMMVQLTISLAKGWFKLPIKRTIIIMWVIASVLPIVGLFIMYTRILLEYQKERLRAFITSSGDSIWLTSKLKEIINDAAFVGNSGKEVIGSLPDFNRDYIFSYVLNTYGTIAGILLIVVLAALVLSIFSAAINQKNQLGCVMGCGCGMVLLMNILMNIIGCIGVIPPTSTFLPFFSAGGSNMILSYALVGIVLSIYRYKSVYPQHVSKNLVPKKISID